MTGAQLDGITSRYLATSFEEIEDRLALEWTETGLDVHRWDLGDEAEALTGALASVDYTVGLPWAKAMLPEASEETLRKLARRLIEAKLVAIKAELRALSGEPLQMPQNGSGGLGLPAATAPIATTPKVTLKVSELAILYGDERVALKQWSPRTEFQHRQIYIVLADLLHDPHIGAVTKDDMRKLLVDLPKLPANLTKRYPTLTPSQALDEVNGAANVLRLAPRSVNKYLQLTRSLFTWALEHDYIDQNPASILRSMKEGRARDDRKPFSDEDLIAYFAQLDAEPNCPPFLFWIPRIMAFSGCRLGEAAQLRKQDLRQERGVWVLDVNDLDEDKRLKTDASRRLIPIHPRLIEMGLLNFVARAAEDFLWPADMRSTNDPRRGDVDKLSKLLGRRLDSAGITDPKKTAAHSFRHTMSARLTALSIPEYQISDILGHENDSMSTGRYGQTTDLAKLHEVLSLLKLPL